MIDQEFEREFFVDPVIYESDIDDRLNSYVDKYGENLSELITIIHNCVVAGWSIDYSYEEIVNKIYEQMDLTKFVYEDVNRIINLYVSKYAIIKNIKEIGNYIKIKRNIYKEVAAKKYNIKESDVTDLLVDEIKEVSDRNSYGIEEEAITNWDEYFYNMCLTVGRNSKCFSRKIGAILVQDKSIISTGYNGPPRGIPTCDMRWKVDDVFRKKYNEYDFSESTCPRRIIGFKSGEGLDICVAGHAERNALINAARNGIRTKDTILYMSCNVPCSACLVEIINSGVREIVVTSMQTYDSSAMYLLENSNLDIRLYNFL